jgi:hypothetical protein
MRGSACPEGSHAGAVGTAFGNGPGQLGLSSLRVRVPYDATQFALEAPSAVHAVQLGAR